MEQPIAHSSDATKLVLIVEDDPDLAGSLAEVLEDEGYGVRVATNGREALDALGQGTPPDLILLDMGMPVMDGWQFSAEQRKMTGLRPIPVVVVTADGNARGKAESIHAAGHLTKPVTIDRLLDEVQRLCGARA
jgi:CheY-like chemotaxis protein